MSQTVYTVYFSPTHSSKKYALAIAGGLSRSLKKTVVEVDLTLPAARKAALSLTADDVLVFAFPVYGGRIPQPLEDTLARAAGKNAPAVIAAVYGNRDYDDALLEARDVLSARGFRPVAAGAFLAEHSMTAKLAAGRPDQNDLELAAGFGAKAAKKISAGDYSPPSVKGNTPYKERSPSSPVLPKTTSACTGCKLCAKGCPMGVVSLQDPRIVSQGCIRCRACVKGCPVGAKYFESGTFDRLVAMLEENFSSRKESELFF